MRFKKREREKKMVLREIWVKIDVLLWEFDNWENQDVFERVYVMSLIGERD